MPTLPQSIFNSAAHFKNNYDPPRPALPYPLTHSPLHFCPFPLLFTLTHGHTLVATHTHTHTHTTKTHHKNTPHEVHNRSQRIVAPLSPLAERPAPRSDEPPSE